MTCDKCATHMLLRHSVTEPSEEHPAFEITVSIYECMKCHKTDEKIVSTLCPIAGPFFENDSLGG